MKKIASLFMRNYDGDRMVRDEVVPGSEWVLTGEGIATQKHDGTACRMFNGLLWRRFDAKLGRRPPMGFDPAQEPDPISGHWPGWMPIGDGPEDRWHREALENGGQNGQMFASGTYELVGPKINGNPERYRRHTLIPHGSVELPMAPRTYRALKDFLSSIDLEGIVWHHSDGRMVKIKASDFGIRFVRAYRDPIR